MSGGVDSSVAAALLVDAGFEVVGVTMKTFCYSGPEPAAAKTCCGLDGIADARRVADALGIAHYVFDVEEEFTRDVIDDFVSEYAEGRTPNPCVRCNANTKFRDLMQRGVQLECKAIASGHYVQVEHTRDGSWLRRGVDANKDQAYFLWGLPPDLLPKLLFPLGHLTKPEVRERARALGLVTAEKPESQEICFVPTGDYRDLLRKRLRPRHPALEPGNVVSEDGTVLGRHAGYAGFTVGQRRGLGGGFDRPMFVLEVRPERREVVVGPRGALMARGVEVGDVNWLAPPPLSGTEVRIQIRHRAAGVAATVQAGDEHRLTVLFDESQAAVTPGQSAVVFDSDDRVVGGGRIARRAEPVSAGEPPLPRTAPGPP